MSRIDPRKARTSALGIAFLENRNLMTAKAVGGLRGFGSDAAMKEIVKKPSYDIAIHFAYVGSPGNASIPINGFVPPSRATVPARVPHGDQYQYIGGVPYVYAIGQTEITAGQYVTFLNTVDPNGENPVMPYTGVTLLNTTTRTQFYTMDPKAAAASAPNSQYVSEGVVFHALPPKVGTTNFRQFYNPQTGAYAYPAASADVQFFTSRGYQFEGYAWSVN
jgi:hypothetical protein